MSVEGSDGGSAARAPSTRPSLESIGFGADSVLMNDPKLFVDERFLASLLVELEGEFGRAGAHAALFEIGLGHGLRDARRVINAAFGDENGAVGGIGGSTSLSMCLGAADARAGSAHFDVDGHWPERHESLAWLSRLAVTDEPTCFLSAGYTSGWLSGTHDRDLLAVEIECVAAGGSACRFVARDIEHWRVESDLYGQLPFLPTSFTAFRERSRSGGSNEAPRPRIEHAGELDPSDDAVHIWGPVMILPLNRIDDAIATVDMLGRDTGAGQVRVVVLDLRNQMLDDGLMAVGLERVLDCIQTWGAEAILTGVSPLAQPVIEELEATYVLTRKDLAEAIASAFQIAEAQRHLL